MSQNLPIVSCSFGIFCVLRHPNHFVLVGANNRNVIITYRFLAVPHAVQANRDFFCIDCMTVYLNYKYFPYYTRELPECLLGISPSGRNPCGAMIHLSCLFWAESYSGQRERKSVWQGSAEGFQSKICELVSGKLA